MLFFFILFKKIKKMLSKVLSKEENSTSISNPDKESKSKIGQTIFDTIKDKLYLRIPQESYLFRLFIYNKEVKIEYNKLHKFLEKNKNITISIISPDIIKIISNVEEKSQNSTKNIQISEENTYCEQEINYIENKIEELIVNNDFYFNLNNIEKGEKEETKEKKKKKKKKKKKTKIKMKLKKKNQKKI